MSEFGPRYRPVTEATVNNFPVEAGIAIDGIGMVRPYGMRVVGSMGRPYIVARVDDDPTPRRLSVDDHFSGMSMAPSPDGSHSPDGAARIAFRYYKRAKDGGVEKDYRTIRMPVGEIAFAHGVLTPDHEGEADTWYIRGLHDGHAVNDPDQGLIPGGQIDPPNPRNFSMARIVNGPLGDPLTNAPFRHEMGIAEIPPAGV